MDGLSAEEKHAELDRVVHSGVFQNARQLQRILDFVATNAIESGPLELTESTLASKVFGRSEDFDPTIDTTVRTSVYRLRSKLREYYASEGKIDPVIIEIPKGHYRPVFRRREQEAPETLDQIDASLRQAGVAARPWIWTRRDGLSIRRLLLLALSLLLTALVCLLAVRWLHPSPKHSGFDLFWSPFLNSSKQVLIYTGTNVVYRLPRDVVNQYSKEHHVQNNGLEFPMRIDSEMTRYLQPDTATFITKQDSYAGAVVDSLLSRHGIVHALRYGSDISFGDLRSGPTILIGAFNNSWTLEMTKELRFVFYRGDTIQDQSSEGRSWSAKPGEDWAVISRLLYSKTGAVLMAIAGIGATGTQAAAEFVTDPQSIAELTKKVPSGWGEKNLQILLHTKVVDDMPSHTEIVATYCW